VTAQQVPLSLTPIARIRNSPVIYTPFSTGTRSCFIASSWHRYRSSSPVSIIITVTYTCSPSSAPVPTSLLVPGVPPSLSPPIHHEFLRHSRPPFSTIHISSASISSSRSSPIFACQLIRCLQTVNSGTQNPGIEMRPRVVLRLEQTLVAM
jgi:hypothetical protein